MTFACVLSAFRDVVLHGHELPALLVLRAGAYGLDRTTVHTAHRAVERRRTLADPTPEKQLVDRNRLENLFEEIAS